MSNLALIINNHTIADHRIIQCSPVNGGAGADNLTGGAGLDVFVYSTLGASLAGTATFTGDTITDFASGVDKFDVSETQLAAIKSAGGLRQGASYTAVWDTNFATTIAAAITAGGAAMIANGAAVVTITGTNAGTYLVLNDATTSFSASADDVILLGSTSSKVLAVSDFV